MNHSRREVLLCLAGAAAGTLEAKPLLEKVDVFEAGKDGYEIYRIPGIVVTRKGTVLAFCEARKSSRGDWGTIDIMLRRSSDGGRTWSPRQKIADVTGPHAKNPVAMAQKLATPDERTYNNPTALAQLPQLRRKVLSLQRGGGEVYTTSPRFRGWWGVSGRAAAGESPGVQ